MKKFNWGHKIAILYIGFVILILSFVFRSLNQTVDLVCKDYYEKEIKYQSKIEQMKNLNELGEDISTEQNKSEIIVTFPKSQLNQEVSGSIHFYNPSDSKKDFVTEIKTDESKKQTISKTFLNKGYYKIQIEWKANQKEFYSENKLVIN